MAFNFWSWFSSTAATVEADIVKIVAAVKKDVAIAEADINAALKWLAAETPTIVADLQIALQLATAVGGVSTPVLAAANAAVGALNAFAAIQNKGTSSIATDAQSVLAGYKAFTSAQAAVAQAKADAASAATKK